MNAPAMSAGAADDRTTLRRLPSLALSREPLPASSRTVWLMAALMVAFAIWASVARLDEVSVGDGKVIPSSQDQEIQSLEGGILVQMHVREGDIVEAGQVLAQLDPTRTESAVGESAAKIRAALASVARLTAEVNGTPLVFPDEVRADPALVKAATALYQSRRKGIASALADLRQAEALVREELVLTEPLVEQGAASAVEALRLKRQLNDLLGKQNEVQNDYLVTAREELAKANAAVDAERSIQRGRTDVLTRLTFTAPMRGIVKSVAINTVGGVVAPGGKLLELIPLDDRLLIEARVSPRDIAFIHPGQEALVKITAYDYSIYGGLHGEVTVISPDTIQDEVDRDVYYYRVYLLTESDQLVSKTGQKHPIVPGMIATVDIRTGEKTVLSYLMKPFNKAGEALRER